MTARLLALAARILDQLTPAEFRDGFRARDVPTFDPSEPL